MRLPFQEIASRITGFSTPIFGISWNAPVPERTIVRNVLIALEDKQSLFAPRHAEVDHEVAQSVTDIRQELTEAIQQLVGTEAEKSLRAMRAACRHYLRQSRLNRAFHGAWLMFLGQLRAEFGWHVALLAVKYGIDLEEDLASIIPAELREPDPSIEDED